MSRKPTKKTSIILICAGSALIIGGILFAFLRLSPGKKVSVDPVENLSLGWVMNDFEMSGTIASDSWQDVSFDKNRKIIEICVAEGDEVKTGDPLYQYDATADAIDFELKSAEIESLTYEIEKSKKEYKKYAKKDYVSTLPEDEEDEAEEEELAEQTAGPNSFLFSGRICLAPAARRTGILWGEGSIPPFGSDVIYNFFNVFTETTGLYFGSEEEHYTVTVRAYGQNPTDLAKGTGEIDENAECSGKGTEDDPYLYKSLIYGPETGKYMVRGISKGLVEKYIAKAKQKKCLITVIFRGPDEIQSVNKSYLEMTVEYNLDDPGGEGVITGGGGMTKEQKLEKAQEIAKKIREDEVKIKQLRLDVEKLTETGTDGFVRAKIDGVVSRVNDPADLTDCQTMITVKGREGFYVRCIVDELNLSKLSVGQELAASVYDTGVTCKGTIAEIASVPTEGDAYNGGNSNVSGYAVTVHLDGDQLTPGQYVDLKPADGGADESKSVYIHEAYVREEDGEKFVYIARDGKLVRTKVETGKILFGYVQILGDVLTAEDYIAFPYGADVKDGAPVTYSGSLS